MKKVLWLSALVWAVFLPVQKTVAAADLRTVTLPPPKTPTAAEEFHMGTARNPDGHTLVVNGQGLLRDGKPWLPVVGEFHFSRCPENEWATELLKMKAGGVEVVSTYVFWIHHEEIRGRWDWSGQRSLRNFLDICNEIGLPVMVRIGPWCHGEVRNGGFPDWLMKGYQLRGTDPKYLAQVQRFYTQIAGQLRGELWKDGGPVIGIQLENEYHGPAEYLLALKKMAVELGMDVPLYTRTGWPKLKSPIPTGEMLPLYGDYPDGFWDRSLSAMPGGYWKVFGFRPVQVTGDGVVNKFGNGDAVAPEEAGWYPDLTCECGGGMETSYHRRIRIDPEDVAAVGLVKIGSGSNMYGTYMYHGGTNPDGKRSVMNESQANREYNDMPVRSYDFQAPLGEYGQLRGHYHLLRRLNMFLNDFGPELAGMPAVLTGKPLERGDDTETLRWSVRSEGRSGYLFVNNYQRLLPLPARPDVQFQINLPGGAVQIPEEGFTIPANSSFFWPFHLDLDGAKLIYATAQPVCRVRDGAVDYVIFAQTPGVRSDFVFDAATTKVLSTRGAAVMSGGRIRIRDVKTGTDAAIRLQVGKGRTVSIVLLSESDSLACWKGVWKGREQVFLTRAGLILDGDTLSLRTEKPEDFSVAVLPWVRTVLQEGVRVKGEPDGVFTRFTPVLSKIEAVPVELEPLQQAGPAREIKKGFHGAAEAPSNADFDKAAVWRVKLPAETSGWRNLRLRVAYAGDAARFYLDGKLLTDDFYNGSVFEMGLQRYAPGIYQKKLLLKILPLRRDAPIYLQKEAVPDFGGADSALKLLGVTVAEEREVQLQVR